MHTSRTGRRPSALFNPILRLAGVASGVLLAGAAAADTITVDTTDDTLARMDTSSVAAFNSGIAHSLRGAILAVNNDSGTGHTIVVPAGTYLLSLANATATTEKNAAAGDLDILKPVTISGAGSATTIIQAGESAATGIDKIFSVNPQGALAGFAVTISGVTLQYGRNQVTAIVPGDNAGGAMDFDAGIGGAGSLTLSDVVFDRNATTNGDGGALALFNGGTITATNCSFTGNIAQSTSAFGANGGAIFVGITTNLLALTCNGCSFVGNSTAIGAGGVAGTGGAAFSYMPSTFTITNSRIVGNVAAVGAPALAASPITGAAIEAANNWFGSNAPDPSLFSGTVNASPNLMLTISVSGMNVVAGVTTNSSGESGFTVPDSTPVAFAATLGSISPATAMLAAGAQSATYAPSVSSGTATVSATVDGQTVDASVVLTAPTPFGSWQQRYFGGDAGNPAIAGELADPDHDGFNNLMEYALILDPNVFSNNPLMIDTSTGSLSLMAIKNPSATDLSFTVEVSDDLQTWTTDGTTVAMETQVFLRVLDSVKVKDVKRRFIRLRVAKL